MKHNSSSQNSCSQVCCLVCATKVRRNTRWWKWETNQAPLYNTGTLVNMPGTLVKKYRYPRHRQNINTKHPRQKIFFLGAIVQRWNVPRSRDLHWMFLMPHVSSQIRHFIYKPLQTEWEPFFFPSRRPRPSPFWRGILQVPSYALPLCRRFKRRSCYIYYKESHSFL